MIGVMRTKLSPALRKNETVADSNNKTFAGSLQ